MTWTLYVFLAVTVNGIPLFIPTVLQAPIEFPSLQACAEHGKRYLSPETQVVCDAGKNQVLVQ